MRRLVGLLLAAMFGSLTEAAPNPPPQQYPAPIRAPAPDLQIDYAYLAEATQALVVHVQNSGPLPADMTTLRICIDEDRMPPVTVPALAAGETAVLNTGYVVTGQGRRVVLFVDPDNLIAERDEHQNAMAFEIDSTLPLVPKLIDPADVTLSDIITWYDPYFRASSRIANAAQWTRRVDGIKTYERYHEWPGHMRNRLHEFLLLLEQGYELPLSEPVYIEDHLVAAEYAEDVFLAHLAQSYSFNRRLGLWPLEDLTDSQLWHLLASDAYLHSVGTAYSWNIYPEGDYYGGASVSWNPRLLYHWLRHLNLLRPTQDETAYALSDWYRAYVVHAYADVAGPMAELNFGAPGYIQAHRLAYPMAIGQLNHGQWGCGGGSGWYAAVLRTVNIPVIVEDVDLSIGSHARRGHSSFRLPTVWKPDATEIGVRILHSDDLYAVDLRPYGPCGIIPSSRVFFSTAESDDWFEPPLDLDPPNSDTEQAIQNRGRYYRSMQWGAVAGPHLVEYIRSGHDHLDLSLQGVWHGDDLLLTALPFLYPAERAAYIDAIETVLTQLSASEVIAYDTRFNARRCPRPYDPARLRIDTVHPRLAYLNTPYWSSMQATGATGGVSWVITEGALPSGITLSSGTTAVFEGTPTESGLFDFTLSVADSSQTAERQTRLAVLQRTLRIGPESIPDGVMGRVYSTTLTGSGGTEEGYSWHLWDGPDWLHIEPAGTPDTLVSGSAVAAGEYEFTVRLVDSGDNAAWRSYILHIHHGPSGE